ncbi:solute carrier organic anion transporter family member 1C1 [Bombina bombina]|uniref:solute carrier organic anion transporter family member 1C1 n=1 Tax=Bombina bombina TaxID=8345 RepID=UPI00235B1423|nr:solute carrier organic anion transporter family member 1C1 [Bombina bombina]
MKKTGNSSGKKRCQVPKLKMFLCALSYAYLTKAFAVSYSRSMITQIERRFNIPSSLVGAIDGSFDIGNLLVIVFVSYFGSKFHRPRVISVGCFVMFLGACLAALPHFLMRRIVGASTSSEHYIYSLIYDNLNTHTAESLYPILSRGNLHSKAT